MMRMNAGKKKNHMDPLWEMEHVHEILKTKTAQIVLKCESEIEIFVHSSNVPPTS